MFLKPKHLLNQQNLKIDTDQTLIVISFWSHAVRPVAKAKPHEINTYQVTEGQIFKPYLLFIYV